MRWWGSCRSGVVLLQQLDQDEKAIALSRRRVGGASGPANAARRWRLMGKQRVDMASTT
jgi:hypothetical protein